MSHVPYLTIRYLHVGLILRLRLIFHSFITLFPTNPNLEVPSVTRLILDIITLLS